MAASLRADFALSRGALGIDVALEVGVGECLALLGPSGAGKSSCLRVIAGLLRAQRGTVRLGEQTWMSSASGRAVPVERRRVGYVFQDYALFPRMAAWRNVAYGIAGGSRASRRQRAHGLLERFGLGERAGARADELSGGERQRVALARALACEPSLLLLDEPLSALDTQTRGSASRELAAVLAETDVPALVVTHDFAEAALLADRVAILDRGRIVQRGTASEVAAAPASAFVADLSGASVLRGVAGPGAGGLTVVELEGGGRVSSTDSASGPVALSVFPWEISLELPGASPPEGSALNHLRTEVVTVSEFGNRARVGLLAPQPLAAEVTSSSIHRLGIRPGMVVEASWKATATRLISFGPPQRGGCR